MSATADRQPARSEKAPLAPDINKIDRLDWDKVARARHVTALLTAAEGDTAEMLEALGIYPGAVEVKLTPQAENTPDPRRGSPTVR